MGLIYLTQLQLDSAPIIWPYEVSPPGSIAYSARRVQKCLTLVVRWHN
jgi:hypothetical protein